MLTAEIIRAKNKCGCTQCIACYIEALAEENMIEELRMELNGAGLLIDEYGVKYRADFQTA